LQYLGAEAGYRPVGFAQIALLLQVFGGASIAVITSYNVL
jgi:hypothetical protein